MADEPKKPLLKKNGKFVKKNGKLVRTDDPENCECCTCVECCETCFDPPVLPRIIATRLRATATEAIVEWDNNYPAPQVCNAKFEFIYFVKNSAGRIIATIRRPSNINVTTEEFRQPLADACGGTDQVASIEVVLHDPNGNCRQSNANPENGPDYSDICAKKCKDDGECKFWYKYSVLCGVLGPFETQAEAAAANKPDCQDVWTEPSEVAGFCCEGKCYPYKLTCSLIGTFPMNQDCRDSLDGKPGSDPDFSKVCCGGASGMAQPTDPALGGDPFGDVVCSTPFNWCSKDGVNPAPANNLPQGFDIVGCAARDSNPLP